MRVIYMCENRVKWRFSQMRRLHISTLKKEALIFHTLIMDWEWLNFIKLLCWLLAFVLPNATVQSRIDKTAIVYKQRYLPFSFVNPEGAIICSEQPCPFLHSKIKALQIQSPLNTRQIYTNRSFLSSGDARHRPTPKLNYQLKSVVCDWYSAYVPAAINSIVSRSFRLQPEYVAFPSDTLNIASSNMSLRDGLKIQRKFLKGESI
jgi:aspartate carbamoyltransferase regulatory subunit